MKKHFSGILAAIWVLMLAPGAFAGAERQEVAAASPLKPAVARSAAVELSPPLRSLTPIPAKPNPLRVIPLLMRPMGKATLDLSSHPALQDPVLQELIAAVAMPFPTTNFDGVTNVNAVLPPDTQGDVGPNHYVQWVNLSFQVFDKNGASLFGPAAGNTLWQNAVGQDACKNSNDGDPITLYDHQADRWLMSQFALPNFPNGPFYQCIAVSTSGDPTGSYFLYQFQFDVMNDYPKFGIWPDGYYLSINQFAAGTGDFAGAGAVAFERDKMLLGEAAQRVYFDLGAVNLVNGTPGTQPASMLPSDWDGQLPPPTGAPNYFVEVDDAAFIGPVDALRLWKFSVDWTHPANSTFGIAGQPNDVLPVAPFNLLLCAPGAFNCITQPGTAQQLDSLGDRLMYRLQYRNFGDHEALVTNHTVDVGSGRAGIRWYEIRDPAGTPVIFQQGTYAPADTEHRWMGSIAQDSHGNMALGYSVASGTVFPSVRYTGRLVTDPLGEMSQGEAELIAGSGSQTSTFGRWGDYSMMAVDPSDDCTFWYTQEYVQTTGAANWQTRIGAFRFPSCKPLHLISAIARPGGRITPAGSVVVAEGSDQTFSIRADPGSVVTTVKVDGSKVGKVASFTFTNVTADHEIIALFKDEWKIRASARPGGTITPAGVVKILDNKSKIFRIQPDPGFVIHKVVVDGKNVGAVKKFKFTDVTANHKIRAYFSGAR